MSLNFNTQPYYDDFNEDKNFHKILFKPGVAVQGRELTQSQSILQDQIGKLGKFVLADGSKVTGGQYYIDTNAKSLNLKNTGSLSTDIENFSGLYIVGETSKCVGLITSADIINFYLTIKPITNTAKNFESGENLKLFVAKSSALYYLSNPSITSDYSAQLADDTITTVFGVYGDQNSYEFTLNSSSIELGDVITFGSSNVPQYIVVDIGSNSTYTVDKKLQVTYNNATATITKFASRTVLEVGLSEGVYFTNNHFVKALPQTVIPDKKTQFPSCVIGFEVVETIVDFVDDTSLLDPAQGSYNYTAPGADRYKIYLELVSKPTTTYENALNANEYGIANLTSSKFIELLRIKNGVVVRDSTNPKLGELENTLARQMYDHAGNFIVSPYTVSFQESNFTDASSTVNAEISAGKAYVFGYEFDATFPTHLVIDKARETESINEFNTVAYYGNHITINNVSGSVPNPQSGSRVELHSVARNSASNNSIIGYAQIRNIQYVSTNEYYLNLYNISAPQNDIANTKSIILPSGSNYSTATFSANVVQENATTTLVDPGFNKLLYELPYKNVASLSNTSITLEVFDTLTVVSNTVAIHTGTLSQSFPSGLSTNLSTDLKNNHFLISTKATNGYYTAGNYVNLSDVSIKTEQVGSEFVASLNFTKGYSGTIDIKYGLKFNSATKKTKTLTANHVSQVNADVFPKSLGRADISLFKGVFKSTDPKASYAGVWASGTTYNASDVVLYGEKLYASSKNSNVGSAPEASSPNWNELRDVTSRFLLNNGQTENMYDHGSVAAKTTADSGLVFVLFDYYEHSSTGEYISFDSYPVNYSNIPTTTINGVEYNLRDYIDFRPRKSNDVTAVIYDTYKIPSSDFTGITFDMSYYLGRIDKLVLTKQKNFQWIKGKPTYSNYVPPADLVDAMTLATIQFNPYTAKDSDIIVKYMKHRRYTMDDIGKLDTRIQNVEYYTSLNLVEKDVMSRNIIDSVTGSRMKNGFVVDPFIGYGVMALADNYKNISLDLSQQLARPSFSTKYENLSIKDIGTLTQQQDLISFPYTETQVTLQFLPTGTTNINPFDTISYAGDLVISPQADIWVDTENKPIINVLNDNAAAIRDASSVPGLLFDEWNAYYATHPYKDLSGSVDVIYNNVDYKVSTTSVVQSDIVTEVSNTVIPYARSIPITFKATHLSPLTKMYVYVNGRMVNAYVQPLTNPTGQITGATITNPGSGYNSSTSLSVNSSSTVSAAAAFEIYGSTINGVELTNNGVGYPQTVALAPTISGAGTNGAINLSMIQPIAGDLYTDEAGECSGVLYLPNDSLLRFPAGELLITVCDTPNYDFDTYAIAKAQATFYSSGRYRVLQETITSIRQPYVKKVGTIVQPEPDSGCRIVVQSQINYLTNHYAQSYSNIKSGTLTLPVYLNVRPTAPVTVTFINASEDMSSNSSISFDKSSLTFTTGNYSTPQYITLSYNLGDRAISAGKYIDNMLPTYIEYYGSSDDKNYNYIGTVKPIKSWTKNSVISGVSTTKLFPYSVLDPNQVLPVSSPYLNVSPVQTSVLDGKTFFTVTYGGGDEIGWWSLHADQTYPLTFTAASDSQALKVQSSRYEHYDVVNNLSGAVRTVANKTDHEVLTFKYFLAANSAGMANVTVTTTSSNPHWNNLTATTTGVVSSSLGAAVPAIVVHPNITSSPTTGTVTGGVRYTTESGGSHSIAISLSKQPTQDVTVSAASLDLTEGTITGKSEDGLTIVSGNTVTFTPAEWNSVKAFVVTGTQDYIQDGNVDYTVKLLSSSSDTSFNGLITNVPLVNQDIAIPKGEVVASVIGTSHTTEKNNGKVRISVALNKKPYESQIVTVTAVSSDASEGVVTSGGTLYFNENTWNIPQLVEVTGQEDYTTDGDVAYQIIFTTSTPRFSEFTNSSVSVGLTNDDYVYKTDLLISTDNSRAYSAIPAGRPAASWMPAITVADARITTAWGVSVANSPTAQVINTSKNAVTIRVSAYLGAQRYSDDGTYSGYALVRFSVNVNNADTLISKLASIPYVDYVYARNTKTIDMAVWVYNNQGTGTFYRNITITGLYYDAAGAGFQVTETLTTTTTTKTIRVDDYTVLSTTTSTSNPQQIVPWNTNPESHLAAYKSLNGYPLSSDPGESFPVADVNAATTSANTYRKNNVLQLIDKQKQLVNNITAKIAGLSPNVPAALDRSLMIETNNLTLLNIRLQTL